MSFPNERKIRIEAGYNDQDQEYRQGPNGPHEVGDLVGKNAVKAIYHRLPAFLELLVVLFEGVRAAVFAFLVWFDLDRDAVPFFEPCEDLLRPPPCDREALPLIGAPVAAPDGLSDARRDTSSFPTMADCTSPAAPATAPTAAPVRIVPTASLASASRPLLDELRLLVADFRLLVVELPFLVVVPFLSEDRLLVAVPFLVVELRFLVV